MAVLDNTTKAADVIAAVEIDVNEQFSQDVNKLMEILGIFGTETVAAGTAMYQTKITGSLNTATVAEGDETPLSKYKPEKVPIDPISINPYRRLVTAQAILKTGLKNALVRTDNKMATHCRKKLVADFFALLANGTTSAKGFTLQAALAYANSALQTAVENNWDEVGEVVYFVNNEDVADHLAAAQITTQTVFGMKYVKDFLGTDHMFITALTPKGTVYATPVNNLRIFTIDFSSLDEAGLKYEVSDKGMLGISHDPNYKRNSVETYMLTGGKFVPEMLDYIVVSKIGKTLDDMTKDELTAYANEHDIALTGKTTKADILAAIKAAEE